MVCVVVTVLSWNRAFQADIDTSGFPFRYRPIRQTKCVLRTSLYVSSSRRRVSGNPEKSGGSVVDSRLRRHDGFRQARVWLLKQRPQYAIKYIAACARISRAMSTFLSICVLQTGEFTRQAARHSSARRVGSRTRVCPQEARRARCRLEGQAQEHNCLVAAQFNKKACTPQCCVPSDCYKKLSSAWHHYMRCNHEPLAKKHLNAKTKINHLRVGRQIWRTDPAHC